MPDLQVETDETGVRLMAGIKNLAQHLGHTPDRPFQTEVGGLGYDSALAYSHISNGTLCVKCGKPVMMLAQQQMTPEEYLQLLALELCKECASRLAHDRRTRGGGY